MEAVTSACVEDRPRLGGFVRLYSGGRIWPLDPRPGDELAISGADAAHMLAGESRFCSATFEPYSVGQHSVHVSQLVAHRLGLGAVIADWVDATVERVEFVLAALLHDLVESWLKDIPGPWKKHVWVEQPGGGLRRYSELESAWVALVFPRFGLAPALVDHPLIKVADKALCATEKRDLYRQSVFLWYVDQSEMEIGTAELVTACGTERLEPWAPSASRREFIERFERLSLSHALAVAHRRAVAE